VVVAVAAGLLLEGLRLLVVVREELLVELLELSIQAAVVEQEVQETAATAALALLSLKYLTT
jgi:hypothetical protein